MAETKNSKKRKPSDLFTDDLDSMLNPNEDSNEQNGLIDDDDVIDRLLTNDSYVDEADANAEPDDIDKLIGDGLQNDDLVTDFDEFGEDADDFFSDTRVEPETSDTNDDIAAFETSDVEPSSHGERFNDQSAETEDSNTSAKDELENMTEIDEFSDEEESFHDDSDFLLADFDISPDEDNEREEVALESPPVADKAADQGETVDADIYDEFGDEEFDSEISTVSQDRSEEVLIEEHEEPAVIADTASVEEAPQADRINELMAELASVSAQLDQLVKHQHQLKQQLHLKYGQEELHAYLEDIEELKSEQKKAKKSLDVLANKKPVPAYVANVIAVLALLVAGGLGMQGYIAKVQLGELADYLGKLKEQITLIPKNDAAEQDMLNKRMDELAQANATMSAEIAKLTLSFQGGANDSSSELSKKLDELNQQDMKIGAAIESLQSKVTALEKGNKTVLAKQPAKKIAPRENWAVNLVAFKQDWYAKRKAEEFSSKGVPAKVNKVESKGEVWYRLVVDGFDGQYDAAAYAARVKKTLNLDSVWVAKVKK